jgi:hypothetical protein
VKRICLILLAWFLAIPAVTIPLRAQSGGQSAGPEQTLFSIGGREEKKHGQYIEHPPVEHPAPLPDEILKALRADTRLTGCLQTDNVTEAPASWFSASEIHLHANDQVDFVVLPVNQCLFGASVAPVWVFGKTANGYDLIMKTDTLQVEILNSRTNGYRDINVSSITVTEIMVARFNYDGQKYQLGKVVGRYKMK